MARGTKFSDKEKLEIALEMGSNRGLEKRDGDNPLRAGASGSRSSQESLCDVTEQEGFEPPVPFGTAVFKTAALSRSATAPTR